MYPIYYNSETIIFAHCSCPYPFPCLDAKARQGGKRGLHRYPYVWKAGLGTIAKQRGKEYP
jgi:hypothetical protein